MATRTHQLYSATATLSTAAWTTLYTVPAGKRTIFKWFSLQHSSDGATARGIALAVNVGGDRVQIVRESVPADVTKRWDLYAVLNAGDKIEAALYPGGGSTLSCAMHAAGAELAAP